MPGEPVPPTTINPLPTTINPLPATTNPLPATTNPLPATTNPLPATTNPLPISNQSIGLLNNLSSYASSLTTMVKDSTNQRQKIQSMFDNAKENLKYDPLEVSISEKNLYLYDNGGSSGNGSGEDGYKHTILARFGTTADELKKNSIEKQQQFMLEVSRVLKQYDVDVLSFEKTKKLLQTRQQENKDLKKKINMFDRVIKTNERKVVYENENTGGLFTYRRVLLFFYYSALVVYIIFGNFIPDKLYLNYSVWAVIVIFSILPIILNMFIKWIFILVDIISFWLKEIPHKDVYVDL